MVERHEQVHNPETSSVLSARPSAASPSSAVLNALDEESPYQQALGTAGAA